MLTAVKETPAPAEQPAPLMLRKVMESDFPELRTWLIPKLLEKYPRAETKSIEGWLTSTLYSPASYAFFRSPNAALLVEMRIEPLEPLPVARERFLRLRCAKSDPVSLRKEHYAEGMKLHTKAIEWVKQIRAVRYEFGIDSDIPSDYAYDQSANAKQRTYYASAL